MRKISTEKLKQILADHQRWLTRIGKQGKRANLREANLVGVETDESTIGLGLNQNTSRQDKSKRVKELESRATALENEKDDMIKKE